MTTLSFVRSDTMLVQHCHSVEDERYITTMWQRWHNIGITLWQHNIEKLHNFMTLPQCCYNVENDVILQCSGTIVWTLYEHWWPTLKSDQTTTFRYHCHNVVVTLKSTWFSTLPQRCDNVAHKLCECCGPTKVSMFTHWELTSFPTLSQCCYNVGGTHQESEI